jgi:hypothetical protein
LAAQELIANTDGRQTEARRAQLRQSENVHLDDGPQNQQCIAHGYTRKGICIATKAPNKQNINSGTQHTAQSTHPL